MVVMRRGSVIEVDAYLRDITWNEAPRCDYHHWPHKAGGTSLHVTRTSLWTRFLRFFVR